MNVVEKIIDQYHYIRFLMARRTFRRAIEKENREKFGSSFDRFVAEWFRKK